MRKINKATILHWKDKWFFPNRSYSIGFYAHRIIDMGHTAILSTCFIYTHMVDTSSNPVPTNVQSSHTHMDQQDLYVALFMYGHLSSIEVLQLVIYLRELDMHVH